MIGGGLGQDVSAVVRTLEGGRLGSEAKGLIEIWGLHFILISLTFDFGSTASLCTHIFTPL